MWEIGDRVIVVETPEEKNIWRLNISAGDKGTVMAKRERLIERTTIIR